MVVKIEVIQTKGRFFTETFPICVMIKFILKASKQTLKHYYTSICHNLTPVN